MDLHPFPASPRVDLVTPPARLVQPVPPLFPRGALEEGEEDEWFFNVKVHHPRPPRPDPSPACLTSPRRQTLKHLEHVPAKATSKSTRHGRMSREQSKVARDPGAGKPLFTRHRKLKAMTTPSPAELREQIDSQTARSIGDSLIFHNIPERCEDTPEAEVIQFCQDYLVGRRIKHVKFGQVHKMEQRFSKDAPIAARFTLTLPASSDQSEREKYQPLPYIPAIPKRRLPRVLKTKSKRKAQYCADN